MKVYDKNGNLLTIVSALGEISDVDVPSPLDGYVTYWDAASGLWKCKQLDHGELAGLGDDDHTQYLNIARHDTPTRHPLGTVVPHDDHGELTGLADDDHSQYIHDQYKYYHDPFQTMDKWTSGLVGSGSLDWQGVWNCRIYTGATINSESRLWTGLLPNYPSVGKKWRLELQCATDLATSEALAFLTQWQVTKPPSLTSKHLGWKVINKRIWASSADGTTEEATDTGIDYTGAWATHKLYILWYAANEVRFYIDDTLRATHTTHLPVAGDNHYVYISIKNTSAVNRGLLLRDMLCRG